MNYLNAQVTHTGGCYDHLGEYRRIQAISSSPEFTKKIYESVANEPWQNGKYSLQI